MSRAWSSLAGVPPAGDSRSGARREEAGDGDTPRHVFDVGVEAAVLVDDDDGAELAPARRLGEIAFDGAALPGELHGRCRDPRIVGRDHGGDRSVLQQRQRGHGGGDAAGEGCKALEEDAPVERGVGIFVIKIDDFLIHLSLPIVWPIDSMRTSRGGILFPPKGRERPRLRAIAGRRMIPDLTPEIELGPPHRGAPGPRAPCAAAPTMRRACSIWGGWRKTISLSPICGAASRARRYLPGDQRGHARRSKTGSAVEAMALDPKSAQSYVDRGVARMAAASSTTRSPTSA